MLINHASPYEGAAVTETSPDIIALSELPTTTMVKMKYTIAAIEEAGLRDSIKIIGDEAPVTKDWFQISLSI